MRRTFNTFATITAAAVSRSNQKKMLRNIKKLNETNRNLVHIGKATVDQVVPYHCQTGNLCISGGEQKIRNKLIVQSVLQTASVGISTVILHEGNYQLEKELVRTSPFQSYFRVINSNNPFYDPIIKLNDNETAILIVEALSKKDKIDASAGLYLRALTTLLRKRGITPYIRMLGSCPHNSIQSIIVYEEQAGNLTSEEAIAIRNDINAGIGSRGNIEYFFSQLQSETSIIAWKSHLYRSTSIQECIESGGTIAIDVDSTNKKTQMALIVAEIEHCLSKGYTCRLIFDIGSISDNELLSKLLKNVSQYTCWTLSTPDIGNGVATTKDDTAVWLARSNKAIIFSHSLHSAEKISRELGEYEYIEVTQAHADNNSVSQFGLHFGNNRNVTTSKKRERIIKPEEISSLQQSEFIMLDNTTASLYKGQFD